MRVQVGPELRPVEVGDLAAGNLQPEADRVGLARAVVDDHDPDGARARSAGRLGRERAVAASDERDVPAQSVGRERRARVVVRVVVRAAEAPVDRAAALCRQRADVDEDVRLTGERRGEVVPAGTRDGDALDRRRSTRRSDAHRRLEHVRVRNRRGRDRVRRAARRADRSEAERVSVVPGCDHGDDAGCDHVPHRCDQRVVCGLGRRATAGEVDDVHPVAHGEFEGVHDLRRVRDHADRGRHGKHAVVAEVRSRRHARQSAGRRMVGAPRGAGPRVAGGDAGHVRAVERRRRVDCEPPPATRGRPREDARDDHLGRRPGRAAPREAGGIRKRGRIEERVRRIDAVVDDPDLDALSARAGRLVQHVRADHGGAPVRVERVAQARVHPRHEAELHECGESCDREVDRQRVEDDLEPFLDPRLRDRTAELHGCAVLCGHDARQVAA